LEVNITKTTLTQEIEQHPDYPSLFSISDVLTNFGIENIGIKISHEKLADLPRPFITQVKGIKTTIDFFTLVKDINDDEVHFFDPEQHQWRTISQDEFFERASDVFLLFEASANAGETDYLVKKESEKRFETGRKLQALGFPVATGLAAVLALYNYGSVAALPTAFILLSLIGLAITTLLLWYELDQHNPVLQQICNTGKRTDCGAVLHSKAAKIGGISLSLIGFSYFMGLLLFALFSNIAHPFTNFTFAWLNAVAAPYIIFSLYYQWQVVKQWCVMCLAVVGVLFLQLATAVVGNWYTAIPVETIPYSLLLSVFISFLLSFVMATILFSALQKAKAGKQALIDLQKMKHNKIVFEALLQKQNRLPVNPDRLGISLGNPNGSFKIIKVCNPYCGPCSKAHSPLEELLHHHPDIQVQLIFTATNSDGDFAAPPVKHFLAIAEKNEETVLKQALDEWYLSEKKDYTVFAAKYPMNGEIKKQEFKLDKMKSWCAEANIKHTPTFFVSMPNDDGTDIYYQLPKSYNVTDLKYFVSIS